MVALGFKLSGGHPAVLVETGISKQPRQAAGSDESLLASDLSRSTAAAGSAACVQLCTLNSSLNRCHPSNAYNSKLKTSGHPDSQEGRTWGGGCSGSQTPTSTNPRPHWLKTEVSFGGAARPGLWQAQGTVMYQNAGTCCLPVWICSPFSSFILSFFLLHFILHSYFLTE